MIRFCLLLPALRSLRVVGSLVTCLPTIALATVGHLTLSAAPSDAADLVLTDNATRYDLTTIQEVLPDPGGALTLDDVLTDSVSTRFQSYQGRTVPGEVVWLRVTVTNHSAHTDWILEHGAHSDRADLHVLDASGNLLTSQVAGAIVPLYDWPLRNNRLAFPVTLVPGEQKTLYTRRMTGKVPAVEVGLTFLERRAFNRQSQIGRTWLGIFYGLLGVLALYNGFVFLSLRDRTYLHYVLFLTIFLIMHMAIDGTGHEFLWPGQEWGRVGVILLTWHLGAILYTQFARSLLNSRALTPVLDRVLIGFQILYFPFVGLPLIGQHSGHLLSAALMLGLAAIPVAMAVAIRIHRMGYRPARYFIVGYASFALGYGINMIFVLGLLPATVLTVYGNKFGLAIEAILLSLALADRINVLREEKDAQELAAREAEVRARASELQARVIRMDSTEDFETVLEEISVELNRADIRFDTCSIEVMDEPVDDFTMTHFERYGIHYADYSLTEGGVNHQAYHLTPPFTDIVRRSIERFVDGRVWHEHFEEIGAILEIPVASLVRLRIISKSRTSFTEGEIRTLQEFTSAIALGYARFLDFREIQKQSSLKSAFLSSMSHELRTPMNIISAVTEHILGREARLSGRNRENLVKVGQATDHLAAMVDDLLDLSRIESGDVEVNVSRFRVSETVAAACDTVAPLVKEGVDLSFTVAEDTGDAETDEPRVRQMLINLLSNAVKFTDAGSVTVRARREEETLVVEVADTGVGIPSDILPEIFEEYRQVEGSRSSVQQGTGLGLSITRKFAELLGGTVEAHSAEGVGSTFTIRVPGRYEVTS